MARSSEHIAVASLIGHCEAIAASGALTEPAEQSLRLLIAETLTAFGMQHHQEFERDQNIVNFIMRASR